METGREVELSGGRAEEQTGPGRDSLLSAGRVDMPCGVKWISLKIESQKVCMNVKVNNVWCINTGNALIDTYKGIDIEIEALNIKSKVTDSIKKTDWGNHTRMCTFV